MMLRNRFKSFIDALKPEPKRRRLVRKDELIDVDTLSNKTSGSSPAGSPANEEAKKMFQYVEPLKTEQGLIIDKNTL